jgi:hypothetical protein
MGTVAQAPSAVSAWRPGLAALPAVQAAPATREARMLVPALGLVGPALLAASHRSRAVLAASA